MLTRIHYIFFAVGALFTGASTSGVTYLLLGASPEPSMPVKTIDYYMKHTDERKSDADTCQNDPGGLGTTPNCVNVAAAQWQCDVSGACAKSLAPVVDADPFNPKYLPADKKNSDWFKTLTTSEWSAMKDECSRWHVEIRSDVPRGYRQNCNILTYFAPSK